MSDWQSWILNEQRKSNRLIALATILLAILTGLQTIKIYGAENVLSNPIISMLLLAIIAIIILDIYSIYRES